MIVTKYDCSTVCTKLSILAENEAVLKFTSHDYGVREGEVTL